MNGCRILMGGVLLVMTGCQMFAPGSDGMPTVTRTGMVKDIVIREDLTPATVTANPGDEIRWINKRQGTARVVFLDPVMEMLSCQRNFGGIGSSKTQYTAKLSSNDSASVCFRNPSQIRYVVRADSNLPSGELNIPGSITIDSGGRTSMRESSPPNRETSPAMNEPATANDRPIASKDEEGSVR